MVDNHDATCEYEYQSLFIVGRKDIPKESTIMKRLLDSLCDLNLLLNKKFQVPTFHVHSSNISVIKTPIDFYETLKVLISNF